MADKCPPDQMVSQPKVSTRKAGLTGETDPQNCVSANELDVDEAAEHLQLDPSWVRLTVGGLGRIGRQYLSRKRDACDAHPSLLARGKRACCSENTATVTSQSPIISD
jgi:hypothetical protein